ncbi:MULTISPECIES: cryptochrome/photolyase family protein [Pseudoalteromonas]|uniref:Cryptochrome/photolyase family protein n=1 Tax=Pseudoalteromonas fuliginea TaxID=1872678 RepID=A0ABQ6RH10_9GAMM|nr:MULTISPECIES: cryptochrome/photolyase family protein [Pseudoalteromonas]KAA1154372.1 cryptochrome/photolyase family protein [Pseudoalteromonas fuliginea]KAA1166972.1 cryptochrome/photolyase family protein [Pseudoalteromonas fuliginea]KDC54047.1 deoxyribodipyrimidine photolyase [Pseudoalteromonas sp. S3431]
MKHYKTLRLILGDQLNPSHSWFKQKDNETLYIIAELAQETHYVKHHIQKLCAFFHAMENFASALSQAGFNVLHLTLDETCNDNNLPDLLNRIAKQYQCSVIEYQYPDEFRLHSQLEQFKKTHMLSVRAVDSEHFLFPFSQIKKRFVKNKHVTMEHFYRDMRKQFDILMDSGKPEGGKWNFDSNNRNKFSKNDIHDIPSPKLFTNDVKSIISRLNKHKVAYFGSIDNQLTWPTTRKQAISSLDYFCEYLLVNFGKFQDAMTDQSKHNTSLYHSRLSFALNTKILHPLYVIKRVITEYKQRPSEISISQVEGFIRQILGWREYVRAIYWVNMPDYATKNQLQANNKMPSYFWTGSTKMNCLSHALTQSLETSYAHHIQRLMVIGNFCMLTGINPDDVDNWYLGVYIDAIEWVEMPNTRGMSQFADDGIIATKPYAASGNYINKMSDYCKRCQYDVKQKVGEKACPLNSLYWNFMHTHRSKLEKNPRIGMVYKNWDRQTEEQKTVLLKQAAAHLIDLESL